MSKKPKMVEATWRDIAVAVDEHMTKLSTENENLRAALLFMVKALEGYGEIDEEDHLALTAARAALGEKE